MKRISLILIAVIFISACSLGSIGKANPTATVPPPTALPQPTQTQIVEPTLAPLPTDTEVALPTLELATDTPAAPADTATPEAEAWRITPMPGSDFMANEKKSDPSYDAIMVTEAKNLAIPSPYYWDIYSVAGGLRYKLIKDYFVPVITQMGYAVSVDVQIGTSENYLMTFIKKQTKSKIYLEYKGSSTTQKSAAILIFYSNP